MKKKQLPETVKRISRRWLVHYRSEVQQRMLELDECGAEIRKREDWRVWGIYGMLVGVIFSLWRSVFLIQLDRTLQREIDHGVDFLGILIDTNMIGFHQDVRTADWSAGYYINNAALRLFALTRMQGTQIYLRAETRVRTH